MFNLTNVEWRMAKGVEECKNYGLNQYMKEEYEMGDFLISWV